MKEITHRHIYSVFHWAASLMSSSRRIWSPRIYFVFTVHQVSHHVTASAFLPLFYPSPHRWGSLFNWLLCGFHWALKPPPWRTILSLWALLGPHIDILKFPSMSSVALRPPQPHCIPHRSGTYTSFINHSCPAGYQHNPMCKDVLQRVSWRAPISIKNNFM